MDTTRLRIADTERVISPVLVSFILQVFVKLIQITGKIERKLGHIFLGFFTTYKLLPSGAEVFK